MAAPIRDTGRLRLLDQQARLRDQIARDVARPDSAAAPRGRKAAPGPGLSLEPPMPKPRERRATAANLAEARRTLGDAVGIKPFKDYVRRTYGEIDDAVLREFLRGGENTQLFGPPPRSDGKMATTGHKDSWYLDLIELRKGDPKYKFIMTAQNAYTGYLFARPMPTTAAQGPEGSAAVFTEMLKESVKNGQGPPVTVTTDGSLAEWKGEFEALLKKRGIIHRQKEPQDANSMGKLDATQQRLRALLRVKVDGSGHQGPWSERLPGVVATYNNLLGHEGSFGSPPVEVIGPTPTEESDTNLLDFQVMRQMARNLKHNTELNEKNKAAVVAEGAFRHALHLKESEFDKAGRISRIKYSENVHQFDGEDGPYVVDTEGERYNPKLVKEVPVGSLDVRPPAELRKGTYDDRIKVKESLWPQARELHRWLKTQKDGAAHITITEKFKERFRPALSKVKLGFLKLRKPEDKPSAIAKLFQGWFRRKGQKWRAVGDMPVAFQAKPDEEEEEEDEDDDDEEEEEPGDGPPPVSSWADMPPPAPPAPPPAMRMRLRGKQAGAFGAGEEEFRVRFLGPLRTWLATRRFATSANLMRRLREMRGFPAFARRFPFYAKADNIASRFPQALSTVPGGTTRNPHIAAKDIPAPTAEFGPTREAGTVTKGPARPPGGPAGTGLGAALLARRG